MQDQLDLFAHVAGAYASAPDGILTNDALYNAAAERAGISQEDLNARVPIGRARALRSPVKQRLRWYQQALRAMGVLERVPDTRGVWRLAEDAGRKLHRTKSGSKMIAFSTNLGVAVWANNEEVFPDLGEPVMLAVTSPPYPLRTTRAYGNVGVHEYIDFITRSLAPIIKNLSPQGSVVLNLSQDIFEVGSPARSTYLERLVIALEDRLGLALMDRFVWANFSKPPGPIQWASKKRVQTNVAWEPIYWFAADPHRVKADNRLVLEPHTERHKALIARGGEARNAVYCDGAYRITPGSFGNPTEGRIPRNVFVRGHQCKDTAAYRRFARQLGLVVHGAPYPLWLPSFFIRFLTEIGDLVVDPFAGTQRTALAAERLGRRWVGTENILEYARASAEPFRNAPGFEISHAFAGVNGLSCPLSSKARVGEQHGRARMTAADVINVRKWAEACFGNGETPQWARMARELGVSEGALRDIVHRRTWTSVM